MRKIDISTFNVEKMMFEHFGSVVLEDDGEVRFQGMNARSVREYYDSGAVGLGEDGVKYPRDGAAFLNAVRMECNRTSFVRAVEVK